MKQKNLKKFKETIMNKISFTDFLNRFTFPGNDAIVFTNIDEEPNMITGWICNKKDCSKLKENVRFWITGGGNRSFRRVGNEIEIIE
jgi:hypothetical protein